MRVVSGMRPTGRLHLGHYLGVIKNWLKLQDEHECHFFVADWHALSTSYEDKLNLKNLSIELAKDWLAAGIDPQKSTIFIQSSVKEHSELYLLLNMITPVGWLERNPTYKDQLEQLSSKDINMAGFLTYPVLQAADIIMYDAQLVPIGEDQRPHLEIAREIVRRFHHLFNRKNIFIEPQEMLSETPKLLGLDGRKMSKSYDNSIYLSDDSKTVMKKLKKAKTDTKRARLEDAGNPEVCLIYDYHKEMSEPEDIQRVAKGCRSATIGCGECKQICHASIERVLEPIRRRRASLTNREIKSIINEGNYKAVQKAKEKMREVNSAIFTLNG